MLKGILLIVLAIIIIGAITGSGDSSSDSYYSGGYDVLNCDDNDIGCNAAKLDAALDTIDQSK